MALPHVQVILGNHHIPAEVQNALKQMRAVASFQPLREAVRNGPTAAADAVLVIADAADETAQWRLRELFQRLSERPRATLVLHGQRGRLRLLHPPTLPISFATGLTAADLAARLATMVDMRESLEALQKGVHTCEDATRCAARQVDQQVRLASQVQQEFLPERLPRLGRVSFSALFRPAEYVSGDIYDVRRLDEEHVAIAVADACGHGIPAALLTVFIKRALRGKEIVHGRYRILPPNEVLSRLNDELLDVNLSECRFVAATYAVLNTRTFELDVARGGSPYPILRRADGTGMLLRPAGGVVGVLPGAHFEVEHVRLEPGDSLLICTDGLEALAPAQQPEDEVGRSVRRAAVANLLERHCVGGGLNRAAHALPVLNAARSACLVASGGCDDSWAAGLRLDEDAPGSGPYAASITGPWNGQSKPHDQGQQLAPDNAILGSAWYRSLLRDGASAALDQLAENHDQMRRLGHNLDDLTVVGVHIAE